jgi:hypothetical protein
MQHSTAHNALPVIATTCTNIKPACSSASTAVPHNHIHLLPAPAPASVATSVTISDCAESAIIQAALYQLQNRTTAGQIAAAPKAKPSRQQPSLQQAAAIISAVSPPTAAFYFKCVAELLLLLLTVSGWCHPARKASSCSFSQVYCLRSSCSTVLAGTAAALAVAYKIETCQVQVASAAAVPQTACCTDPLTDNPGINY